jgi:hypothetical protein
MGMFFRLLPKPVRKARRAMHPVRNARRAITPRPVKQARRAVFKVAHPVEAFEGALEDVVVGSLRGGRRSSRSARSRGGGSSRAPARSTLERERAASVALLEMQQFRRLLRVHLDDVQTQKLGAPPPESVDARRLNKVLRAKALDGVSLLAWSERRRSRAAAAAFAVRTITEETGRRRKLEAEQQERIDDAWLRVCANEPQFVLAALQGQLASLSFKSFECADTSVRVSISAPGFERVPERLPDVTPTGKATSRGLSKTDRNELYAAELASHAVAAARAALEGAPGLESVEVDVLSTPPSSTSDCPVLRAVFRRSAVRRLQANDPLAALASAKEIHWVRKGRTHEVKPLGEKDRAARSKWAGRVSPGASPAAALSAKTYERELASRHRSFDTWVAARRRDEIVPSATESNHEVAAVLEGAATAKTEKPHASPPEIPSEHQAADDVVAATVAPNASGASATRKSKLFLWIGVASIPLAVVGVGIVVAIVAVLGGVDEWEAAKRREDRASRRKALQAIGSGIVGGAVFVTLLVFVF